MAVGRISGPLLKANLLRDGVDLAFENDLLYLDVNNGRIGIKTTTPTDHLTVNGTSRTTDLIVDDQADLATFTISGNTISSSSTIINLEPTGANPVVYQGKIQVDDLTITGNTIESLDDITIRTNGTGVVNIYSNVEVEGNVHATGTIKADGNIIIGNADTDSVSFNAEIISDIVPDVHNTYMLGSPTKKWADIYVENIIAQSITTDDITVDGINLILPQGNILYVSKNGSNSNSGTRESDPFLTVKHALSQATTGTTVYIYPGDYEEIFPLTVPVGVSVKGAGIRATKIKPTVATKNNDAFLLNGETLVEELTVADFFSPGYAFKFATNFTVTSRSPYIRNLTVITRGSVTSLADPLGFDQGDAGRGAYIDGSVATVASNEAAMLFHSVTFIVPGALGINAINGARIEWLNSFTYFADKSMQVISGSAGIAGAGKTRLRINNRVGTWTVGNTLSYYDTDGSTVLASGVIESITDSFVNISGKSLGFETLQDRTGKLVYANGNAKLSQAVKKFGTASLVLDGTGDFINIATQPDFAFPSNISRLAKTITVNGNAAVSATESKFGGSSIAFDGTGDYLSLATSTDFGFGTGDFTIEGWFYKTSALTQTLFDTRTALNENSIQVQSNSASTLRLFVNGSFVLTSSNTHTLNAWNHFAISRASGVTRFFINGVVSTTTYTDATNYGSTKPLFIGATYTGTTPFAGYIDEFRVSNTARYTTTFTPSTTAFTADSASKLLIHGDSTIVDDVGGTATDFTIEGWIYPTVTTYHSIFDFRSVSTEEAIYLGINLSNQVYLYVNGVTPITTDAISLNVWTHVAVVRSNAITKIYVNGTQSGSSWTDITNYGTTKPLRIGAWYNNLYGFTGYVDEVRISKGIARYTSTFVPATTAFTGDLNTVLLLHFNGTNNSTLFVDDGLTLQDLRTSAGGTSTIINFADYNDFGAEVRSIGSAAVYGNYGIYADGVGCILYLISENLAYIGAGKKSNNDPTDRIPANEVVELNGARVYYTSVDNEGNFKVGDSFYVNQKTGEVLFNNQTINVTSTDGFVFTDGVNTTTINAQEVSTGNIKISGNTIESLSGEINVVSANGQINVQDVRFFNNIIQTTTTNLDLVLQANGTGNVVAEGIQFNNNNIQSVSSNTDITLTPQGTGSVIVNSTTSLQIPVGASGDRPITPTNGMIRFNSTMSRFEGWNGTYWIQLGGVQDISGNTYIKPEATPGANDNTLYFYANSTLTATINQTQLATTRFQTDSLDIVDNTISSLSANQDIRFLTSGTGGVRLGNLKFRNNAITNVVPNAVTEIVQQGTGYVKFAGTGGFGIPVGNSTTERPANPIEGMMRYNSDFELVEVYNGQQWTSVAGTSSGVTFNDATDIGIALALSLG